jgi:hypothetical protein
MRNDNERKIKLLNHVWQKLIRTKNLYLNKLYDIFLLGSVTKIAF